MAKHVLNIQQNVFDFILLGINCNENQYRVLSLLNDTLDLELALGNYIPLNLDNQIFNFSLFRFTDDILRIEYFFIPNLSNYNPENKSEEQNLFAEMRIDTRARLVKELPETDFFLIIKGEEMHGLGERIKERLKKVKELLNIQIIQVEDLPSRNNLIF